MADTDLNGMGGIIDAEAYLNPACVFRFAAPRRVVAQSLSCGRRSAHRRQPFPLGGSAPFFTAPSNWNRVHSTFGENPPGRTLKGAPLRPFGQRVAGCRGASPNGQLDRGIAVRAFGTQLSGADESCD